MDDDAPLLHRRQSAPDGKLTKRLDVQISEDMEETLITLARVKGFQNRSEYVRDVLHKHVYGELETIRLMSRAYNRNPGNSG